MRLDMKKFKILILLLSFVSLDALSQVAGGVGTLGTGGTGGGDIRLGANGKYIIRSSRLPSNGNIDYDEHLYKNGRNATVILLQGDTITGQYLYNMETESLEQAGTDKVLPWNIVKSFTFAADRDLDQVSFSNIKLSWPDSEYGGFIQDVSSSPFVKVKHYLEFVPSSYDPSTEIGSMHDEIETFSTNYLKLNDKWIELPENKSALYNLFGSYSESLRKYARKNKLKAKNPEHVGKMVSWVAKNRN